MSRSPSRARSGGLWLFLALTLLAKLVGCQGNPSAQPDEASLAPGVLMVTSNRTDDAALAVIDLESMEVDDRLFEVDIWDEVAWDTERLYLLQKYIVNGLGAYLPWQWDNPVWETDDKAHYFESRDVARCAGNLFLSLNYRPYIPVLDPDTGQEIDQVDLNLAQADGTGMDYWNYAANLVGMEDQLIVSIQTPDFSSSGSDHYRNGYHPGALIQIDCLSRMVVDSWVAAEGPVLVPVPGNTSEVLFFDKNWSEDEWALQILNVDSGAIGSPFLDSDDLGGLLWEAVVTESGRLVFILERLSDQRYSLYCSDLDGSSLSKAGTWSQTLEELVLISDDLVMVAANEASAAIGLEFPTGIMSLNPESCTANESSDWLRTRLRVVSMAAFHTN